MSRIRRAAGGLDAARLFGRPTPRACWAADAVWGGGPRWIALAAGLLALGLAAAAPRARAETPTPTEGASAPTPPSPSASAAGDHLTAQEGDGPFAVARRSVLELLDRDLVREAFRRLDGVPASARQLAEYHYLRGVIERRLGQLPRAEEAFGRAVELDPAHAAALGNLAALLTRQDRLTEAAAHADRAVALAPDDASYRADRATIRFRQGKLDGAIVDARESLRLRRRHVRTSLHLGLMLLIRGQQGDPSEAVRHLALARQRAPEDDSVALTYGTALMAADRTQAAVRTFDRLLAREPSQIWAAFGRGLCAYRQGDETKARELGEVARSGQPGTFTAKAYNPAQFHAKDSLSYLRWLDGDSARDRPAPPRPGGAAAEAHERRDGPRVVVSSLDVGSGCMAPPIRRVLETTLEDAAKCPFPPGTPVAAAFRVLEGRASPPKLTVTPLATGPPLPGAPVAPAPAPVAAPSTLARCLQRSFAIARFPTAMRCEVTTTLEPSPPR